MRPSRRLDNLASAFDGRLDRLDRLYSARPTSGNELDRITAYVVIELCNAWAQYTRSYYLSCAIGARRKSGLRVTHSGVCGFTIADALASAALAKDSSHTGKVRPRDEPDWNGKSTLSWLGRTFAFSNVSQIQAALSVKTVAFDQLVWARNFFAHRSEGSAENVRGLARKLGIVGVNHPTAILSSPVSGIGSNAIDGWLATIRSIASQLAA